MNKTAQDMADELNNGVGVKTDLTKDFLYRSKKVYEEVMSNIDKDKIKKVVEKELKVWINSIFTYMYDFKSISFTNASVELNKFFSLYNFKNGMIRKHSIAARIKNEIGRSAYLVSIQGNEVITDCYELVGNPVINGNKMLEVNITKNNISMNNNVEFVDVFNLKLDKNGVIVSLYKTPIKKDAGELSLENQTTIKGLEYIPVVIDYANEFGRPVWESVASSIDFYGSFEHKMQVEFEYVKTQMKLNPQWSDKTSKQIQGEIEEGDIRIHEDFNDNSAESLSYLSNGGVTTEIAKGIRNGYKDQIKEQLFIISQSSGGNNKHTQEAVNDNVYSYSYAWFKKDLFGETLSHLYWMIADISKRMKKITIEIPEWLECEAQLSRPLEMALNLNSDGKELDNNIVKSTNTDTNGDKNGKNS